MARLERRVAERRKWLALVHDVTREINEASTWDDALHRVLHRICEAERWQVGCLYLPDRDVPDAVGVAVSTVEDERFRPVQAASARQPFMTGQSLPGRVYAEGLPLWVNHREELLARAPVRRSLFERTGLRAAAVLPVAFGSQVIAVLELLSDQPHPPTAELTALLDDVSAQIGRVLERELANSQMADIVWREQQDLLHTLHDSLGQTLTGLGMLSSGLSQRLTGADAAVADTARQIARQAQLALEQIRQLARGIFPVDVDAEGLTAALRRLAETTQSFHPVRVEVEGDGPGGVRDNRVATQLYRIAQEAVTNAVKHAGARTVTIRLHTDTGLTTLSVGDDGVGLPSPQPESDGLGLRIMRSRATSVGGTLSVGPAAQVGTLVTCTVRTARRPTPPDRS